MKFYNSLTRSKDEFTPLEGNVVRMYTCGPTVYNFAHIGNFRAYTFEDILHRALKYRGYDVNGNLIEEEAQKNRKVMIVDASSNIGKEFIDDWNEYKLSK